MAHSHNPFQYLELYARGQLSLRSAMRTNMPGLKFDQFGRRIGLRLLIRGSRSGLRLSLVPVSSTRYFEFPFVASCVPETASVVLDVSSPRLFGLWLAMKQPTTSVTMLNPDPADLRETESIARMVGIKNLVSEVAAVDWLASHAKRYDCIWTISVVEHIYGAYDDSDAMRMMFQALKSGGRLIVTVPVDKHYWVEYRPTAPDGPMAVRTERGYFTQRFYDYDAIQERLVRPLGVAPKITRWWGEKRQGRFLEYCERWIRDGYECTVEDAREFSEEYEEFPDWKAMAGVGVCGLMFER
jgi:hypothetical protein